MFNQGKQVGETPLELPGINAGRYWLLLRKRNYRDLELVIEAPQGDSIPIHELEPLALSGRDVLLVTTLPAGASVYIDGVLRGKSAAAGNPKHQSEPLRVAGLAAGRAHQGQITFQGEKSKTYTFRLRDKRLSMAIWRPDVLVRTRAGRKWWGMIRQKKPNGDILLALSADKDLLIEAGDVAELKDVFPARIRGHEGVKVLGNPQDAAPELEVDPFPKD